MGVSYLRVELKRAAKRLPYMYAGAMMLFLLTGVIAFLAARMLYGDEAVGRISVGVAIPEGDRTATQVIRMLSSMESVSSVCDFSYMDMDQCLEDLENGDLFAVIEVPEGFVRDIIDGRNTPVSVWLAKDTELEGRLFSALAEAGAQTLSASQAGIYAGNELYVQNGAQERIPEMEKDLNQFYLNFSLPRMEYFRTTEVSGTGDVETSEFYMISFFVLFLLFAPVPAGEYLLPLSKSLRIKLDIAGVGGGRRALCRIFGLAVLLLFTALPVVATGLGMGIVRPSILLCGCLVLSSATVAVLVTLVYNLAGTLLGGLTILFLGAVTQHFVAGGFLPEVFLPSGLRAVSHWMPSGILMDTMKMAFLGRPRGETVAAACGMILIGSIFNMLLERRRP